MSIILLSESDTRAKLIDPALHARGWTEDLIKREETPKRALLSLATGAGKTFIAVNLLARIAGAGQLRRALFVCDRDELRTQALAALNHEFGSDAAPVSGGNPQKNARVLVATYQTLDIDSDEADANFLTRHYPENYFSHIIIDECHRSAWGRWSQVLTRNPAAVQVGLTATLRQAISGEQNREAEADEKITADNIAYFGEPVYEYDMSQGMEDGFLAACEIVRRDIFLEHHEQSERQTGVAQGDLEHKRLVDARTGELLSIAEARAFYTASSLEERLILPDRVREMTQDLFGCLLHTGGPEQKTIIFCSSDHHADDIAIAMNNLYAGWCKENGVEPRNPYAFKCTAASGGAYLSEFKGSASRYFVATTVELLTTGVDVPPCRNVVFFKYVRSPISFYQMVGRGTRLDPATGKLMFRVYDYTDATRLFGEEFQTRIAAPGREGGGLVEPNDPERTIRVEGFDVRVTAAGRYILTMVDGKAKPVTVEEYKEKLAAKLVEEAPTLAEFRGRWIVPSERHELLEGLPDGGRSAALVRTLEEMQSYDLYDVLADLGYGLAPHTRQARAGAFEYKHEQWLNALPKNTAATLRALAAQFARAGTEGLENPHIFQTPGVVRAGGVGALRALGEPAEVILETKERLFAA